jgi:Protein of unknown function (DUF2442)
MLRIKDVEPLTGFSLRLMLSDGSECVVNVEPYLVGPVFEPLKADESAFRSVSVDKDLGTIVWPNGADIDPEVLIHGRTPAAWETPAR